MLHQHFNFRGIYHAYVCCVCILRKVHLCHISCFVDTVFCTVLKLSCRSCMCMCIHPYGHPEKSCMVNNIFPFSVILHITSRSHMYLTHSSSKYHNPSTLFFNFSLYNHLPQLPLTVPAKSMQKMHGLWHRSDPP